MSAKPGGSKADVTHRTASWKVHVSTAGHGTPSSPFPHDEPPADRGPGPLSTGPPRMTPLRELQLVEQYRQGDTEALSELLEAYQRRVYSICYRTLGNPEDAADVTQDVLVKIIEGLDSYDGRSKLSTWIIRICINTSLSHLRKQRLRRHASLDQSVQNSPRSGMDLSAGGEHSAVQRIEQSELHSQLLRAVATIDPDMRSILVLRDMQGLDYQQIAEVLGAPIGTVKSRLFRARTALRQAMEELSPESAQDRPD
jgi:RNA polymerase sigma-70 factor (ECF subfamily)